MFVSTYLSDVLRDFRVHTNLDLCEGVDLRTASPGLLFSGYNIVRNSTRLEVCLKVRISNSNARKKQVIKRLQVHGLDNQMIWYDMIWYDMITPKYKAKMYVQNHSFCTTRYASTQKHLGCYFSMTEGNLLVIAGTWPNNNIFYANLRVDISTGVS